MGLIIITFKCLTVVASLMAMAMPAYASSDILRPIICYNADTEALAAFNRGPCPKDTVAWRGAGANLFDVFWASSSGQNRGHGGIGYNTSLQQLSTAKASGIKVFRAFASDWGPNTIFWKQHTDQYWSEFDQLFDAIDKSGLYWIPSIGYDDWYKIANNLNTGLNETMNDCIKNESSVSRKLLLEYYDDFVTRYSNRTSLLMWELGNELNLMVNLPPPWCGDQQCFNTAEMVTFTESLVNKIRQYDVKRPISSGFSMPRNTAWHQEHCPMSSVGCDWTGLLGIHPKHWSQSDWGSLESRCPVEQDCSADPGSGYWSVDNKDQWGTILKSQQSAVNIWSVHHYAPAPNSSANTCYFDRGSGCLKNASVIGVAADIVASVDNVILYVGEFGGAGPNFTGPSVGDQAFPAQVLDIQVANAQQDGVFHLSTIWAWECPSHRSDMVCIYPNSTVPKESGSNRMIQLMQLANEKLQPS